MPVEEHEWFRPGFAPGLRDRVTGVSLGPLLLCVALVAGARVAGASDFDTSGFLRDSGHGVALTVTTQPSVLSSHGVPRCEEFIRNDNGAHTAIASGYLLRNVTGSSITVMATLRVWTGRAHRRFSEFIGIDPGGSMHEVWLFTPSAPSFPASFIPQPVTPGITRCDLTVWLEPFQSDGDTAIRRASAPCDTAFATFLQAQNDLSNGPYLDTYRHCLDVSDWIRGWTYYSGHGYLAMPARPFDEELALNCFDPDTGLASTQVCRSEIELSEAYAEQLGGGG